jgi:predicted nucleotidyltransferase
MNPAYPTPQHQRATEAATDFFTHRPEPEAVLLIASCARGKASRDSCVDLAILVSPETLRERGTELEARWQEFYESDPVFQDLVAVGAYTSIDLELTDGSFVPRPRGWTSGPDDFELEIGNIVAYSVPLWERGDAYRRLRERWLPYYDEDLRQERLAAAVRFCRNNLDHMPLFVRRGLYFQAFDRLYNAYREFLQALFIARRAYPIAYDKWIREQIVEILGLPELYPRLPALFEIAHFESEELAEKGRELERLLTEYVGR